MNLVHPVINMLQCTRFWWVLQLQSVFGVACVVSRYFTLVNIAHGVNFIHRMTDHWFAISLTGGEETFVDPVYSNAVF